MNRLVPNPNQANAAALSNVSGAARPQLESIVAIAEHLDLVRPKLEGDRFSPPDTTATTRTTSDVRLSGMATAVMFPQTLQTLASLSRDLQAIEAAAGSGQTPDLTKSGPISAKMSVLSRSNVMVILRAEEGVTADLPSLESIVKDAFGESAPAGISQIAVVTGLGSWTDDSGAVLGSIPALLPNKEGIMFLDAAILADREHAIAVLQRVAEMTNRLAYELYGADDSHGPMRRGVEKMAGFEPADANAPHGYLTCDGQRYAVCLSGATKFDKTIYPPFEAEGSSVNRKAFIIDRGRDANLQRMCNEFDEVLSKLPTLPGEIELLALASAFVDSKVRNKAEHTLPLPETPVVLLGDYYEVGGGECRQKALLLACLTEHLRESNRFSLPITFHAGYSYLIADGHAYVEATAQDGGSYFADPTHHRFVSMQYEEPTISTDGGIWPYRSASQVQSFQGKPLWLPYSPKQHNIELANADWRIHDLN